jgi:hypothetical protein
MSASGGFFAQLKAAIEKQFADFGGQKVTAIGFSLVRTLFEISPPPHRVIC